MNLIKTPRLHHFKTPRLPPVKQKKQIIYYKPLMTQNVHFYSNIEERGHTEEILDVGKSSTELGKHQVL